MKRKTYITPTTQVIMLQQWSPLLSGSSQGDLGDPQEPTDEIWL